MNAHIPTVEPFCVPDTFVTGSAPLQFLGENIRLTLLVAQRCTHDGTTENAIVSKLVGSRSDMLQIAAAILRGCSTNNSADDAEGVAQFLQAPAGRH
ncbi:hypothetical protein [Mesorhizobium qingshengii]|uniref:Uncharacterized protein n=1 Tax=Mesorhizobium qingshengii TaxID=1165689 RepID=A0A1G5VBQ7_9HYPH|nr:hypothetical protein [Mesorhizobium qingshengii]SDA42455.1 hypothetical protein SAMN02927914_00429 [Mesorhizobium qingshengii]